MAAVTKAKSRRDRPPVGLSTKPVRGGTTRVSVASLRRDPMVPRIERAVAVLLARGNVVDPVDVLVEMQLLAPADVAGWRSGRVPYLERVVRCNLTKAGRLLRILRMHAHDLNLVPSDSGQWKWGKPSSARSRFTKSGEGNVEAAYARRFAWPGKRPFHSVHPRAETRAPAH